MLGIVEVSSVLTVCTAPLQGLGTDGLVGSFLLPEKAGHVDHRPV